MEEWRDVVGFKGLYEVSNLGRVKSLSRLVPHNKSKYITIPERILKPTKRNSKNQVSSDDYLRVRLSPGPTKKHSKAKTLSVLVAQAWIPNPNNKPQVNHIDGDKANNKASNLEWVTNSENEKHAYKFRLKTSRTGKDSTSSRKILQLDEQFQIIHHYDSIKDAATNINGSMGNICSACKTGSKAYGFYWKYENEKKSGFYRSIIQLSISGEELRKFKSLNEIIKETSYNAYSIRSCCQGKSKTAYGYKWKYTVMEKD